MDPSLIAAKKAFANWKRLGKYCGRATNKLKEMALALLNNHPPEIICNTLKIPIHTLRSWESKANKPTARTGVHFVSLPMSEETPMHQEVRLSLPNGVQVYLPIRSLSQAVQFIHTLSKEV